MGISGSTLIDLREKVYKTKGSAQQSTDTETGKAYYDETLISDSEIYNILEQAAEMATQKATELAAEAALTTMKDI